MTVVSFAGVFLPLVLVSSLIITVQGRAGVTSGWQGRAQGWVSPSVSTWLTETIHCGPQFTSSRYVSLSARVLCRAYDGDEPLLILSFTVLFRIFTWITKEKKKTKKQMRK